MNFMLILAYDYPILKRFAKIMFRRIKTSIWQKLINWQQRKTPNERTNGVLLIYSKKY